MRIVFASNNEHKLAEIREALGDAFELVSLNDIGFFKELPETGNTLEANAMEKAEALFLEIGIPVFADDSGLEISHLFGRPGVDTAHYSGSRDAEANMAKVLAELEGANDRSARFRTVIAYISKSEKRLFQGAVEGEISRKKRGQEGFGYDPIFIPENRGRTFAEMTNSEKAEHSHRVRALEDFTTYLKSSAPENDPKS